MRTKVTCLVAGLTLILAACGTTGDDTAASTSAATTTVAEATTTSVAPTTTAAPATTASTTTLAPATTAAPTTTEAPTTTATPIVYTPDLPVNLYPPLPLSGSEGAAGSGCSPGAGPLPSGVWFGMANAIEPDHIEFDLACFYFGDVAYTEGAADGEEVNNDYYIRNVNPALRDVPLVNPTVWTLGPMAGSGEPFAVNYVDWPQPGPNYLECPSDWCLVWLYVNNGLVTDVVEQFVP